ncbi:MAG: SDR family oxidoreductase [Bacteroidota bacterium]
MQTILVTGSNGLVGQKLIYEFNKISEVKLIATSKSYNKINELSGFEFELLDITRKSELEYIVSKYQPDTIINTAAITQVDYCEQNKTECWQINVEAVKNLCEIANKFNTHLIQFSSDFVFDGIKGNYSEEDATNPVSFYGLSKQEAEKTIMEQSDKWTIIRTILVYGVLENMVRSNFVLWVIKNLSDNKKINIVNDQYRMPTLAEDIAIACKEIALKGKEHIYHISGKEFMSIYEIACKIAVFFNLDKNLIIPVSSVQLNEKGKRPPKTGFELTKSYNELFYRPRSFNEGLKLIKKQLEI